MHIGYNNLWKHLADRKTTKTKLLQNMRIRSGTHVAIGKILDVCMNAFKQIYTMLSCTIGDILDFLLNENKENAKKTGIFVYLDKRCPCGCDILFVVQF